MFRNYKTTLTGWVGGIANLVIAAISSGAVKPKDILISVVIGVLGTLAKDHNVTGM